MARNGDKGDYLPGNVRIITMAATGRESNLRRMAE
jgi:hypothetical protein